MQSVFESARRRRLVRARPLTVVACAGAAGIGCRAAQPRLDPMRVVSVAPCPPLAEPRLQFESSFWLNLHNFLVKEAKRRAGSDDDGAGTVGNLQADTAGLRAL